jgi:MFS family permease
LINAAALTICGFSSSLIGGILSDKYEKNSYMTKSRIIMTGHFLAVPLTAIACFTSNFYLAIACFAAKIFVSGSYYAPAITMMQNSTDSSNSGFVVSAYTFYAYLAQTIAPLIFGYFAKSMGAVNDPRVYGKLVTTAVTIGYLGSNIFYYRAGRAYSKMMKERDEKNAL